MPLRIAGLRPSREEGGEQRQQIVLENLSDAEVQLVGWKLMDVVGNEFAFAGVAPARQRLVVTLDRSGMLDKTGNEVWLRAPEGGEGPHVTYTASEARLGEMIEVPK